MQQPLFLTHATTDRQSEFSRAPPRPLLVPFFLLALRFLLRGKFPCSIEFLNQSVIFSVSPISVFQNGHSANVVSDLQVLARFLQGIFRVDVLDGEFEQAKAVLTLPDFERVQTIRNPGCHLYLWLVEGHAYPFLLLSVRE